MTKLSKTYKLKCPKCGKVLYSKHPWPKCSCGGKLIVEGAPLGRWM